MIVLQCASKPPDFASKFIKDSTVRLHCIFKCKLENYFRASKCLSKKYKGYIVIFGDKQTSSFHSSHLHIIMTRLVTFPDFHSCNLSKIPPLPVLRGSVRVNLKSCYTFQVCVCVCENPVGSAMCNCNESSSTHWEMTLCKTGSQPIHKIQGIEK